MTIFSIKWVEHCEGPEHVVAVHHPAACLAVTLRGEVIVNCDWRLDDEAELAVDMALQHHLESAWQGGESVQVALLAQGTPFRRRVWEALCGIPCGVTLSYAALARDLATSPRAIGNACRDNPYAPIVPCHRVVSASGLGGYCGARGGPLFEIKRRLLAFERAV